MTRVERWIYPVSVLRHDRWEVVGTYYNLGVAEKAIADILKSKAKKWDGIGLVQLSKRPWQDDIVVKEWAKEVKP